MWRRPLEWNLNGTTDPRDGSVDHLSLNSLKDRHGPIHPCTKVPIGGEPGLAVGGADVDVAAKANDVSEAQALQEFEQLDVAEAAIGQDRHGNALGRQRLQAGQAQVLEIIALVL